jgi:hypothetical protein
MDKEQIRKILTAYQEQTKNIQEALRVAECPDTLVDCYVLSSVLTVCDFEKMLPEDVIKLFKDIRTIIILHLYNAIGLSEREIARRIGGSSIHIVRKILEENLQKPEVVNSEEVSK